MREAGKSLPNAIAEVREAVDFLRYYADQAEREFDNDTHRPLGQVLWPRWPPATPCWPSRPSRLR
ncbi:bifunctional proline oxidoreductase/transcriptional repressor [Bordetella pertussis]|nr:bifunctional proline oxidoreductase/transcriptional repressor [Bordetella pertussis]